MQPVSRRRALLDRLVSHPGRGGCGVGAIAQLDGKASHDLVRHAVAALGCLEHRGGRIEDTGDGAGLLFATPESYFARFVAPGRRLPDGHRLVVGVLFFPPGEAANVPHWQHEIDAILRRHGLEPLGWRHVPVDESALGAHAQKTVRDVWQVLVGEGMVREEDLPLVCFRVKAQLERRVRDVYVASFSPRTMVYKALATGEQLARFYPDLADPELAVGSVVFHRRYSTNTFSNWYLAQVFRTLCHNGEINTIKANRNAVTDLEAQLALGPILMPQGSDSADMDRVVELFTSHGVALPETIARMMPAAWRELDARTPETVRFYQGVQRALGGLGAWEGPAAVVATDGQWLVGALDRMGLRPLRWVLTRSHQFILGSEIGAVAVEPRDIVETGQLDPGESIAVDLVERRLYRPREVLGRVVAGTAINFAELAETRLVPLARRAPSTSAPTKPDQATLNLFAWTPERVRNVKHMAEHGKEPITSMGFDRPLAALSPLRPPLAKYFKQIVAVVTNPPIDPLREGGAFDLTVHLGAAPQVHENEPVWDPLPQYKLESPFLTEDQVARIRDGGSVDPEGRPRTILCDCTMTDPSNGLATGAKALARRIAEVVRGAVAAVKRGEASIVILSDRAALSSASVEPRLPLPMVLVASSLHNALVDEGRRRDAGIVVETGEVQEAHDAAVLLANGADAIHPYLVYDVGAAAGSVANLVHALEEGLRRVMSKMGICSVDGYRGSRLFEAVGIASSVVDYYLPGITSRVGGIELEDIFDDVRARRAVGGAPAREPDHAIYRKDVWNELQLTARGHDPQAFGRFLKLIEATPPVYLRDLLVLTRSHQSGATAMQHDDAASQQALPLDAVAPADTIIRDTFRGAAMSLGALHRVAHRAIAAAFNKFGAMSNCGEGGEDPRRDVGGPWENARSRIRQVASGRFGVDARYLANADEISIKIGQGAKPGEGGMLPAAKVTAEVALIRKTQVGVALISPPPHHDIYSIEDLAQLVYSLRQTNPRAAISVKVPAVTDIGTIAVGIAKAGADVIDVSGSEGGTGAAAASSIEHAGLPLERALSETHQALVLSGVRARVRLRADGGIKTGYDVAAVLALGADEVSLGTALMIAEQCIFCHGCANGMCPAGITTQSELVARRLMTIKKGRAKDDELPDEEEERYEDARHAVERYLVALADDLRGHLARLGLEHPSQLVGRVDLLQRKNPERIPVAGSGALRDRPGKLDLGEILTDPYEHGVSRRGAAPRLHVDHTSAVNARVCDAIASNSPGILMQVHNTDRSVGATAAGAIASGRLRVGQDGFTLRLAGYAGQALGFACTDGMRIELDGFANDFVAEAMGGGTIVVRPPRDVATGLSPRAGDDPRDPGALSLVGNAIAYGATGGRLFVAGRAGQRVGVRNSGCTIVVEGAGKYAFEYMTGGTGVVLGPVGTVVASGMTGGVVYLLDEGDVSDKIHADATATTLDEYDATALKELLDAHARETGSPRARSLLDEGAQLVRRFVKVVPKR